MEPVYRPVVGVALGLFKVMRWNVITSGEEHIPLQGPAVIATNHVGYLDFVFVGAAARKRGRLVRFLAKQEVFDNRISGPLMKGMKHIPVDRFGVAGRAIDLSVDALRRGEVVGMFPEGTISRSFVTAAGKTGAARMAVEANAPLIPGAVWGSQRILTKGRPKNFERKLPITVDLAPPIRYEPGQDVESVTRMLMSEIERLVEGAQKKYPDEPKDESDSWWLPAHLGGSAPTVEESIELARREREERAARRRAE